MKTGRKADMSKIFDFKLAIIKVRFPLSSCETHLCI